LIKKNFDYIIIGSGLAGLFAAHKASKYGKVAIITKSSVTESNSFYAQGGIACVIDPVDDLPSHINDTLIAGRDLCDEKAVKILIEEGQQIIKEIIDEGMLFDQSEGELSLGLEGGHSFKRILHAQGNSTGKALVEFVLGKISENKNISVFPNFLAYKLLTENNVCKGCFAINLRTGENFYFYSNSIILSGGGYSGLFKRNTNPETATGDAIILAYNAGCDLSGMEFTQFHPTAFSSANGKTFLISEAVRGEGAFLTDKSGQRFMQNIHPLADLAPRDVVAKEIFFKIKKDNTGFVNLNLQHLDGNVTKNRFKNIYEEAIGMGIDFTKEPLPVAPAAHYSIGGIKTDYFAQTNIKGLFACGECSSTGVHGANRLASNSLLECLVFSNRAVEKNKDLTGSGNNYNLDLNDEKMFINPEMRQTFFEVKQTTSILLDKYMGIVRNYEGMQKLLDQIKLIEEKIEFNPSEYFSNNLKNHLNLIKIMVLSALERKESRGCHFREDFSDENDNELSQIIISKDFKITRYKG